MANWEILAQIAETDRGHLNVGQSAEVLVVALPGRVFHGRVKDLGGTTGPPWERRFECKLTLNDPAPELRPGMSANLVVTMETLKNVLWLPAQALFEANGRTFVYARRGAGFTEQDVKLVRRSESNVVVTGVAEGQEVSLVSPSETGDKKQGAAGNAAKAVAR